MPKKSERSKRVQGGKSKPKQVRKPKAPGAPSLKADSHPCHECSLCCSYIALEIDEPTRNREYDYMCWYISRPNVELFIDWEGDWFLKVDSTCEHLLSSGLCGIYETRPKICREFDWEECERHNEQPAEQWIFRTPDDFLRWLEEQRPKAFRRFESFRAKLRKKKAAPELLRIVDGASARC